MALVFTDGFDDYGSFPSEHKPGKVWDNSKPSWVRTINTDAGYIEVIVQAVSREGIIAAMNDLEEQWKKK